MDIQRIAERIGIPVEQWAGDCHGIASAIVRSGALRAYGGERTTYRVVRGHYLGEIAEGSYFGMVRGNAFVQHSWIQTDRLTMPAEPFVPMMESYGFGRLRSTVKLLHDPIIDPTRFAFDGREPYIWIGANMGEYDAGGNHWRMATMRPLPPYPESGNEVQLQLSPFMQQWMRRMLREQDNGATYPDGTYTYGMLMWFGNLSPDVLGEQARPLYRALMRAGVGAIIPLDNRHEVLGE